LEIISLEHPPDNLTAGIDLGTTIIACVPVSCVVTHCALATVVIDRNIREKIGKESSFFINVPCFSFLVLSLGY
jgi:hypothetical protein